VTVITIYLGNKISRQKSYKAPVYLDILDIRYRSDGHGLQPIENPQLIISIWEGILTVMAENMVYIFSGGYMTLLLSKYNIWVKGAMLLCSNITLSRGAMQL
jgi:hypothetical protein